MSVVLILFVWLHIECAIYIYSMEIGNLVFNLFDQELYNWCLKFKWNKQRRNMTMLSFLIIILI